MFYFVVHHAQLFCCFFCFFCVLLILDICQCFALILYGCTNAVYFITAINWPHFVTCSLACNCHCELNK